MTSTPANPMSGSVAPKPPNNGLLFSLISGAYRLREALIRRWGEGSRTKVTSSMVQLFYRPLRRRRFMNMRMALGLTREQFRAVDRAHLEYLSNLEVKIVQNSRSTPEEIKAQVCLEGEEHLREALKLGQGVFLVGDHLGIWPHTWVLLASLGYPMLNVKANLPVTYWRELDERMRQQFGLEYGFVGHGASKRIDEALSQNKIVTCYCDVPIRRDRRVPTRFGPVELLVDPGTAKLLLRYSAPILRVSCSVYASGRDVVRISPHVSRPADMDPETAIRRLTGDLIDTIYQEIQARPAEWLGWSYADLQTPRKEPSRV